MEAVEARATPFEFERVAVLLEVTSSRAASVPQLLTGVTLALETSIFLSSMRAVLNRGRSRIMRLPRMAERIATKAS